jgi:hypothetical protein
VEAAVPVRLERSIRGAQRRSRGVGLRGSGRVSVRRCSRRQVVSTRNAPLPGNLERSGCPVRDDRPGRAGLHALIRGRCHLSDSARGWAFQRPHAGLTKAPGLGA